MGEDVIRILQKILSQIHMTVEFFKNFDQNTGGNFIR